MKSGFLILVAATLFQIAADAQSLPTLKIINSNGNTSITWTNSGSGYFALQSTTNLTKPVVWTDSQWWLGSSGTAAVNAGAPYQFFRLRPMMGLFQFAIFYDVNLEIDPGHAMTNNGPVFCNQNIWEGSGLCTFASTVAAVGTNSSQVSDPFALNYNGGTGPATYLLAGQPTAGAVPMSVSGLGTNFSPAAMRSLLELPPPTYAMGSSAAYTPNGLVYLANACDLVVINFLSGTNFGSLIPTGTNLAVFFQDQQTQTLTPVPCDFFLMRNPVSHTIYGTNYVSADFITNIIFAGFSWITNAIYYDWREGWNGGSGPPKAVQAVQIDVGKFNTWLTNSGVPVSGYAYDQTKLLHSGHHIGSVYVCSSVPLTSTQLPAVRLVHGAQLPNPGGSTYGFTVATPLPIYVWGDYNSQNNGLSALGLWGTNGATVNTLPAALMGDAVTVLSDNWNDFSSSIVKLPVPSSTTVNAAMLQGIVPSNPNLSGNYSGGMENYIRLLENWTTSSTALTFNGSIVALFYSQYATNSWMPTGNYYNAPRRNWAFDLNFTNFVKLPPLTPAVENLTTP